MSEAPTSPWQRGLMTRDEIVFVGIFFALVLALFAAEVVTDFEPVKLGMLLFPFFWIILLAVHELGHAAAAWCCGWYVGQVVIGFGRTVTRFRLGGTSVEVRIFPLEGFVRTVPRDLRWPRAKSAFIYFAGPGVELLIAGAVIALIGWDTFTTRNENYGVIALQSLAAAALAGAVLNLIPAMVRTERENFIPNDGMGIIQSFTRSEAEYAAMIGQTYDAEADDWKRSDDPADWWKRR